MFGRTQAGAARPHPQGYTLTAKLFLLRTVGLFDKTHIVKRGDKRETVSNTTEPQQGRKIMLRKVQTKLHKTKGQAKHLISFKVRE